jgi:hypothetical protein
MATTPDEYIDIKTARRFLAAVVAVAVSDYRGNDAARSAEAGDWLDSIGAPNWRRVLAERRGPGRPRKS